MKKILISILLVLISTFVLADVGGKDQGSFEKGKHGKHKKVSPEEREAKIREKLKDKGLSEEEINEKIASHKEKHAGKRERRKELKEKWKTMTDAEKEAWLAEKKQKLMDKGFSEEKIERRLKRIQKCLESGDCKRGKGRHHKKHKKTEEDEE